MSAYAQICCVVKRNKTNTRTKWFSALVFIILLSLEYKSIYNQTYYVMDTSNVESPPFYRQCIARSEVHKGLGPSVHIVQIVHMKK